MAKYIKGSYVVETEGTAGKWKVTGPGLGDDGMIVGSLSRAAVVAICARQRTAGEPETPDRQVSGNAWWNTGDKGAPKGTGGPRGPRGKVSDRLRKEESDLMAKDEKIRDTINKLKARREEIAFRLCDITGKINAAEENERKAAEENDAAIKAKAAKEQAVRVAAAIKGGKLPADLLAQVLAAMSAQSAD